MEKCEICGALTNETVTTQTIPGHIEQEHPMCADCKEMMLDVDDD